MNHALAIVAEVGTREISVSLWIILAAVTEVYYWDKNLQNISLIQFIIKSLYYK